ncbi:MAG: glycosyltransferase family A protein [Thermoanaerobaculia bacterium]
MSRATISVVVPAFDAAATLGDALFSILGQTLPPEEILVVDDGSTDGTAALAASTPGVTLLRQERRGPAAARTRGARAASGELLAFLDADDLFLPEKLARQSEALAAGPELAGVFAQVRHEALGAAAGERRFRSAPARLRRDLLARRDAFLATGFRRDARDRRVRRLV